MRLKNFYIISVFVHLALLAGIYFMPPQKDEMKKKDDLFARLVSPEELKLPPPAVVLPRKALPPAKTVRPSPQPQKVTPSIPYVPPPLTEEKPVVPGEGKETGRQLPDGVSPKAGAGERTGRAEKSDIGLSKKEPLPYMGRDKLYDQAVIGNLARRDPGGPSEKKSAITFDTTEYRFKGYMRKLKEKIENIWVYPPEARAKGVYGDLKIQFTINKDGRLGAVELVRTSGYRMLDDAAMKALRDGDPYWPLPSEWGMDSYTIVGHFVYSLGGYYVR